jgi:hypothetical protein
MKINLCFFAVLAPLVLEVDAAALNGTVFPSCAVRNVPGKGLSVTEECVLGHL